MSDQTSFRLPSALAQALARAAEERGGPTLAPRCVTTEAVVTEATPRWW